jgi:hypothetical protein
VSFGRSSADAGRNISKQGGELGRDVCSVAAGKLCLRQRRHNDGGEPVPAAAQTRRRTVAAMNTGVTADSEKRMAATVIVSTAHHDTSHAMARRASVQDRPLSRRRTAHAQPLHSNHVFNKENGT